MFGETPTSLRPLSALGQRLGLPHLYAKCELDNPTGTQKDRVAGGLVRAALAAGATAITVGTCGNLGVAIAYACRGHPLTCTVFVPATYENTRSDEMVSLGAEVIRTGACYEDAVEASQHLAHAQGAFDANPVAQGGQIAIREYGAIIDELLVQCPIRLGSIWMPVGNGTCAAGAHARIVLRDLATMIGVVGSTGNTALTASLAAGHIVELDATQLRETPVNEPLVNWRSLHVREAMDAVQHTRGYSCDATDMALVAARNDLVGSARIRATPAGAAGLVGLQQFSRALDPASAHVIILTA